MDFPLASIERLFHGTLEPLAGDLRPGGYDSVFWTAESSCIAQSYIPATGGSTYCSVASHQLDQVVRPSRSDPLYTIAKGLGRAADDVQWDEHGSAKNWRIPDKAMTYREVSLHIEEVLGYANKSRGCDKLYELRCDGWDAKSQEHIIVPAGYRKVGSLVIVEGFQAMRLFDMHRGEGDLTAVQYHAVDRFKQLAADGYDGVVIDDFAQSKTWGNVGHRSIGFFAHAMPRLSTEVVTAANFDWGPERRDLEQRDTPEYIAWKALRSVRIPRAPVDAPAVPAKP